MPTGNQSASAAENSVVNSPGDDETVGALEIFEAASASDDIGADALAPDVLEPSNERELVASRTVITAASRSTLVVGTGHVTGVYFPTGGAICQLYNESRSDANNRCVVTSTQGSIANLDSIRAGAFDFAVVQSDWQHHAFEGTVRLEVPGPFSDLRSLFSIYVEPLTIIARGDANIRTLNDLPGSRIAMGEPGSGQYEAMTHLMSALGWTSEDFDKVSTAPAAGHLEALCLGEVDAVVLVAGHPNGAAMGITNSCDAVLVDIVGAEIDKLVAENPYFAKTMIPGGIYPGNPDPVSSFGVAATLVASARMSDDVVYQLVRAVFEDFDRFRLLHPAFAGLAAREMISSALSAPLHRGAVRYYQERGWL